MSHSVTTRKSLSPAIWLYMLFGALMLAALVWTSLRTLRETPSRQSSIQLPGQGWVTLTLTTDPFPPLPSGPVLAQVTAENDNSVMVSFGPGLPFSMGAQGSDDPLQSGVLSFSPDGSGYQAALQFPTPGNYWLDLDVGAERKVRFQLYVEPAQ